MDRLTKEQRRKNMQAVKHKGSAIEVALGKALWKRGYRYRKNDKTVFGKPDFCFRKYKVVVFADSEFWHGCNWEKKRLDHKSNIGFWHKKIERNIQRDIEVNEYLKRNGWKVIRFWGKDIMKNLDDCIEIIEKELDGIKRKNIY